MAELSNTRQSGRRREVPRLVNLAVRTVAAFFGGCAGAFGTGALLVERVPDTVSVPGVFAGFVLGGCAGFIGVGRLLGPIDPVDVAPELVQAPLSLFEATMAELDKPPAGLLRGAFLPLLFGSFAVFIATGGAALGLGGVLWLSLVLVFHEVGHLLAMRAFGYRHTRILFIPFLGAITTGTQEELSGNQRALVLLAGPMPGLLVGMALIATGATHDHVIRHAAVLLIAINGFNLLPLGVLDGGKLFELLLFSRKPWLQGIFGVGGSALLAAVAYFRHAWLLLALAGLGIASARRSYNVALVAGSFTTEKQLPRSLSDASPALMRQLFDAVYTTVIPPLARRSRSSGAQAKMCAVAMREAHAQALQRPAAVSATLGILAGYVALFAVCANAWFRHR
jgi:hypothetical protein